MKKQLRKRKIRNAILWSLAAIVVLWFIYAQFIKQPPVTVEVQLEAVKQETLFTEVSATGTINPIETVEVGTQVSGEIAEVYVDYNETVKKGQLLAKMDTRNLSNTVQESKANLERAKITVEQTERTLEREKELHLKGFSSDQALEQAQDAYNNAVAALKIAQIQMKKSAINLGYADIVSPIDGVVISRNAEEGQTVAATFSPPILFSIVADLTKMKIEASVDEADIGQVQKGQKVTFTVDAYPEEEFHGVVEQIQIQPVILQNVVTYKTIVLINNPDLKLLPGMTATLIIQTNAHEGSLTVPNSAISFDPEELDWQAMKSEGYTKKPLDEAVEHSVWVLQNKSFQEVAVDVTFTNGIKSAVSGLSESDSVITKCNIQIGEKVEGGFFNGGGDE